MGSNLTQNMQAGVSGIGPAGTQGQAANVGFGLAAIGDIITALNQLRYTQTNDALTASSTQTQAAGTKLQRGFNRVTTVTSGSDACTLPNMAPGDWLVVVNDGGNILSLFPASGQKINDAVKDAAVTVADNTFSIYACLVAGLIFGGAITLEA